MRIRLLGLGLACAACVCGQYRHRFSWQNYCFDHPGSVVCGGHEYAVKRNKSGATGALVSAPPSPMVDGIDWRFADPDSDALAGIHFSALSESPLGRTLITQLGAKQGFTEADIERLLDGLAGVDRIALSIRDKRIVAMLTGRFPDPPLPTQEAGLKFAPISGNMMLFGHAEAVDEALRRIATQAMPAGSVEFAEEWQATSELWLIGAPGLVGPEAVNAGVKRFWITLAVRDRFSSDLALEFDAAPGVDTVQALQTALGPATVEGTAIHSRVSVNAEEARQKFGAIANSLVGLRLAALTGAARQLRLREPPDPNAPKRPKIVIYGLDGGPKEVKVNSAPAPR
jgi:hypothetical protein